MFDDVRSRYRIHLANEDDIEVTIDGRDWAAMEAKQFPPGSILTVVRFMAFNAARRDAGYRRSWEQFNGTDCVHIEDITPKRDDDEDQEDEQSLDPGPKTTNGSGASTSRSSRANRSTAPGVS